LSEAQVKRAVEIATPKANPSKVNPREERSKDQSQTEARGTAKSALGEKNSQEQKPDEAEKDRERVRQELVAVLSPEQQRKLADLARSGLPDDVAQEAALYGFIAPPQRDYDRTQRFGGNVPIKRWEFARPIQLEAVWLRELRPLMYCFAYYSLVVARQVILHRSKKSPNVDFTPAKL
jgi:hypothetical protein